MGLERFYTNEDGSNIDKTGFSVNTKYRGYNFNNDYYIRENQLNNGVYTTLENSKSIDAVGYILKVGKFLKPGKIQVGLANDKIIRHGNNNDTNQYRVVMNYFLFKNHLRLSFEYAYIEDEIQASINEDIKSQYFRAQIQMDF